MVCSAMISPAPSALTHRVNLNRFETGSGAANSVQTHAVRYSGVLLNVVVVVVYADPALKLSTLPSVK